MNIRSILTSLFLILFISITYVQPVNSQTFPIPETDNSGNNFGLTAFFDLRDRESFVQITNTDSISLRLHVQIFNVGNLCNENDFFDDFTISDTHVYNLRNILTNDGKPSGVVLPDNAYGIVVITGFTDDTFSDGASLVGNFRVIDNNGYEYRTNMSGWNDHIFTSFLTGSDITFNFSQDEGITFSEIIGIPLVSNSGGGISDWFADNITRTFMVVDVDIFDLNENPLSCRDVAFACVQPDSNFVDEILSYDSNGNGGFFFGTNGANTAGFEYGINDAIPHTKNGELLCPSNNIANGFVNLNIQGFATPESGGVVMVNFFVGLNNGNGRGSMDALWFNNQLLDR